MTTALSTAPARFFQFRIATLLIAMVWVGLVSLGLRTPTQILAGIIAVLTVLVLLVVILVSVFRANPIRATAIGFIVFCGGYLMVMRDYYPLPGFGPATTVADLFSLLATWVHGESAWTNEQWVGFPVSALPTEPPYQRGNFIAICHHALATFLGVLGAIIAQILYATRKPE
jgi:hypothetical protein